MDSNNQFENQGANAVNTASAPSTMEDILNRNTKPINIPTFPSNFEANTSNNISIPDLPKSFINHDTNKADDDKVTEAPLASKNPLKLDRNAKALAVDSISKTETKKDNEENVIDDTTPITEEVAAPNEEKNLDNSETSDTEEENLDNSETADTEEKISEDTEASKEEEEKPKIKNKRKRKNSKVNQEETKNFEIPVSEINYSEIVKTIASPFVEEDWENFVKDTTKRINDVVISNDMGTTALKQTISTLDEIRNATWVHFVNVKTLFENLTDKEDGVLMRIKRTNSIGSNDNERKNNACKAIMNYSVDGKNANLYEALDETRKRYNYLDLLMKTIQYKSNAVITMLANLKLEK